MRRGPYSVWTVRCVRLNKSVELPDRLHALLVNKLDTDPDIVSFSLGGPRYRYIVGGREKETEVTAVATTASGCTVHMDTTWSTSCVPTRPDELVKQAHAEQGGFTYQLFSRSVFDANHIELKNRLSTQTLLYQAREFNSEQLETLFLLRLAEGPTTLDSLMRGSAVTFAQACVGVLRLWLRRRARVPLTTQLLQPAWLVEGMGNA